MCWILASIAFWAIATVAGQRSGRDYTLAQQLATRLVAEGRDEPNGELRSLLQRVPVVLSAVLLAAYLVAVWAMTTKPV